MAKRKIQVPIQELLEKAVPKADLNIVYANHARLTLMNTELFIDFVMVSPGIPGFEPTANHVQRVVFPIAHARAFVNALTTVLKSWEEDIEEEPAK